MSADSPLGAMTLENEYNGSLIQMTKHGKIEGKRNKKASVIEWLGIPYAKPPIKDLRWKAPQDPDKWQGILETKQYRDSSVQIFEEKIIGHEDCLYLNVWRPDDHRSKLPVFVFLHGGGNTVGSGQDFKGDFLSKQTNSIIISVNYRLGVMGWFRHSALATGNPLHDSGNYGLLDILHALKWVQENIHIFGGDRNNVTLGGHSAGGRNVMAALISPLGKGLFHKAIVLSGGMTTAPPALGEEKSADILAQLLIEEGKVSTKEEARQWENKQSADEIASYLRGKEAEEFPPIIGDPTIKMEPFPHLFTDGHVLPREGFQVMESGEYHKMPMILGCTAHEVSTFAYFDPFFFNSSINKSKLFVKEKFDLYQHAVEYGSKIYAGFNIDHTADLLTTFTDQPPVFAYRFAWGTREKVVATEVQKLFGAPHGADIDFFTGHEESMLDRLFPDSYYTRDNQPGRKKLNQTMVTYVKNFLHTGDPNNKGLPQWEPWQNQKEAERVLVFDADHEQAIVRMSKQNFLREEIVQEMKNNLSKEEYRLIADQLFDGRFFWSIR